MSKHLKSADFKACTYYSGKPCKLQQNSCLAHIPFETAAHAEKTAARLFCPQRCGAKHRTKCILLNIQKSYKLLTKIMKYDIFLSVRRVPKTCSFCGEADFVGQRLRNAQPFFILLCGVAWLFEFAVQIPRKLKQIRTPARKGECGKACMDMPAEKKESQWRLVGETCLENAIWHAARLLYLFFYNTNASFM